VPVTRSSGSSDGQIVRGWPVEPEPMAPNDIETSDDGESKPKSQKVLDAKPTKGLRRISMSQSQKMRNVKAGRPIAPGRPKGDPNPQPPRPIRVMSSPNFRLEDLAYAKIILHALKHPHQTVNGVLLGSPPSSGCVIIVDAVPLQHHWTNLSPMMEVGLGMAINHAHSRGLQVVGYYQAPERVGDTTLSPAGECVAAKIKDSFQTPVALVLNGSKLDEESSAALVSYVSIAANSTTFRKVEDKLRFNYAMSTRTLRLIRHSSILDSFWDFDDYLENNSVPFLTNGAVQVALGSPQ